MENSFEREFDARRLEQVETGVVMEYCERTLETTYEEEDFSDLLFGCMEPPLYDESRGEHAPHSIVDLLYRLDLIREVPVSAEFLPPGCGTSVMDIEYLLGMQESSFESLHGATLSDITEALAQECRVLCTIRTPNMTEGGMPFSLCESSCLAEVHGIDLRNPDSAKVCFESFSGFPVSQQCSLEEFIKVWQPCNNHCYVIYQESCHEY